MLVTVSVLAALTHVLERTGKSERDDEVRRLTYVHLSHLVTAALVLCFRACLLANNF